MSDVIYLQANTVSRRPARPAPMITHAGPRVYMRETKDGIWLVHDDEDLRGGCFRSRSTAFRFVENEFGTDAELVVQPLFVPLAKDKPIGHFRQTISVAQRAVATR